MNKNYVLAKNLVVGKSYTQESRFYPLDGNHPLKIYQSLGDLGILKKKEEKGDRVNTGYELTFEKPDGTTFSKVFDWSVTFFENNTNSTIGGKRTYSRKQKNKKLRKNKSKQSKSKKNRRKSNNRR